MSECSRPVKQLFNYSVSLTGTWDNYMCQELERGKLLLTCLGPGIRQSPEFLPEDCGTEIYQRLLS